MFTIAAATKAVHDNNCGCGCVDDFQPMDRPSIATLYIRWLDRCLPARTWATWLRQYNEMYGAHPRPVEHTHGRSQSCHPRCHRWGS